MSRFFCCVRGETSNGAPPEEVFDDDLFDNLQIAEEPDATVFPVTPPLPANCGASYEWLDIIEGTLNFCVTFFLGSGSFGEVYRCNFKRNNEVGAVKIQAHNNETGHKEFLAEVTTLHKADHPNVIKLLGRCYGRRNRAIVYEFMPNGTLGRHIFDARLGQVPQGGLEQPTRVLDWSTRMRIAEGVAEGLIYLHDVLKVIYGDLNVGNVLLDSDFVPKLSGFGFATNVIQDNRGLEQNNERIKGTPGYLAPECEYVNLVSTKSDVFSYGAFLLVLFTGKNSFSTAHNLKISDWFLRVWARLGDAPVMTVDAALLNTYSVEGLKSIFQTARLCINAEPRTRPAMRDVVTMVRQAAAFPVIVVPPAQISRFC